MTTKFDELTKSMAQSVTRRAAQKKSGASFACIMLARFGLGILTLLTFATRIYAQGGTPLWTNALFTGSAMAVDSSGNVFVTGNGPTVKYSSAGVPLWENSDDAIAIAADTNGNAFVTWYSWDSSVSSGDYATT